MEAQLRVLEDLKNRIEKGRINFKKAPKERINEAFLESRLQILDKQFEDFTSKHEDLLLNYEESALKTTSYIKNDLYDTVTDAFLTYKVELKNALGNKSVSKTKSDASSDHGKPNGISTAKLPKITIPVFSGQYEEWSTFRDLFLSLINNNQTLDDVQRLHYLRSQLSGEAAQLIKHIPITHANYNKCWTLLNNRYNNKRFLANCSLKRLLNQKQMAAESSTALKELLDTTTDCLHELSNLGVQVDAWDIIVIYLISSKLDVETRKQWELQVSQSCEELPTFKDFQDFLEKRYRALEFVEPQRIKSKIYSPKVLHVASTVSCPRCSDKHFLSQCDKFAEETVDQRRQLVKSQALCFNCLRPSHLNVNCRVNMKCKICNRKHNTLLHLDSAPQVEASTSASSASTNIATQQNETTAEPIVTAHFAKSINSQVILATAILGAKARSGNSLVLRALLDQGSQASFITESAVQILNLKKVATKTTITGLGGGQSDLTSKYMVRVNLQSLLDPAFTFEIQAYILTKLTSILPERKFALVDWPELKNIELADPNFNKPNKIDILLGSEAYAKVLKEGLIKDPMGKTMAQDTYLGWIISGEVNDGTEVSACHNVILSMHARVEENEFLKRFWELEAEPTGSENSILSPEEQACEEYFAATTRRDEDGRYIVKLPLRSGDLPCKTKDIALKRLYSLERKFAKNPEFQRQYTSVINEYLFLGHMEEIHDEKEKTKVGAVYLPQHAVIREEQLTTKLRVVFEASAKGSDSISLNDKLMIGPPLQSNLRHTNMRWRQHPVCLAANTVKMYRQVKVADDHMDFQRILWRDDSRSDIKEYRLLRVTFGISSAPYLAVKALHQTARDEGGSYPGTACRIMTDFHIDELLTGCQLLNKTGFPLQNWTSNQDEVLEQIGIDSGSNLDIKEDELPKTLGLTLNRSTDEFHYKIKPDTRPCSPPAPETKRTVISQIRKTFVANRTSENLNSLDPTQWHYVDIKNIPAGSVSRGIIPSSLVNYLLWKHGLRWLLGDDIKYSRPKSIMSKLEQKTVKVNTAQLVDNPMELMWCRFSSLSKLIRTLTYCRQFLKLKSADGPKLLYLTASEIVDTVYCCLKNNQVVWFETEFETLKVAKSVSKTSGLTSPNPLTPGHFLIGEPLVMAPDCNYDNATVSCLRRWQLTQRMIQSFWKRWSHEYLTMFFQRHKWANRTPIPKVGDVVLVKEDNLPPAKWLYGKVVELHPGNDNLVRVVTLKCKDSFVKRPTSKLCILPVSGDN